MLRIQQLMTQNVVTCVAEDSLMSAVRLMWDEDIGAVAVVDDAGRAIAMLTDRDACMSALSTGRALSDIPVREAMSKELFVAHPKDAVEAAELVMREHQVRRLPIVGPEGELKGLLAQSDLVREADRERETRRKGISAVEVTATLSAISKSRVGELATSSA